jgi:hypothetical protein
MTFIIADIMSTVFECYISDAPKTNVGQWVFANYTLCGFLLSIHPSANLNFWVIARISPYILDIVTKIAMTDD